jgi:hypothetical protein
MVPCFNAKENPNLQQGCTLKVEDTKPWMPSLAHFKQSNSSSLNIAMNIKFTKELEIMFYFIQNLEKLSTIYSTYALLKTLISILTKYLQATLCVWCKQLVTPIGKHNRKLIVKLHHHKLDKTTKITHNDITSIDNVPPFWAVAMDKRKIHGLPYFWHNMRDNIHEQKMNGKFELFVQTYFTRHIGPIT